MKIAVVVHGRFHAFDLARELSRRGHDVGLFTNYPKWAVKRFGVAHSRVYSFWPHGVLSRVFWSLHEKAGLVFPDPFLNRMFGRWAAKRIRQGSWDVALCWSGVGEEVFKVLSGKPTLRICHRSSSHIRAQARILEDEEKRVGISLERPTSWIIAREEREYILADLICVPSAFSAQSFTNEGISPAKVCVMLLGVDTQAFRITREVLKARVKRILSGEALRVLNVGTFSLQKGMWDLAEVIKRLNQNRFLFRFVGPVAREASNLAAQLKQKTLATFIPKQAQKELPSIYEWGDIFVLPTLQDGFPVVLAQASASALPILTTANGAGSDLVQEEQTGWILPIRSPEAFIDRLKWCDASRDQLAKMVEHTYKIFKIRDWKDVAKDFEKICMEKVTPSQHAKN